MAIDLSDRQTQDRLIALFSKRMLARVLYLTRYYWRHRVSQLSKGDLPYRIVTYKHIIDPTNPLYPVPPSSYITKEIFRTQLMFFKEHCFVVSLEKLIDQLISGEDIAPNTVAIVFEGGFADFAEHAYPLLKTFRLPATVFVSSAFIETNDFFWEHKLTLCLEVLKSKGQPFPNLPLLEDLFYSTIGCERQELPITDSLTLNLLAYMRAYPPTIRFNSLLWLLDYVSSRFEMPSPKYFMNWEELGYLTKNGITIGTSGKGHKSFVDTPYQEIIDDLSAGLKDLRDHNIEPIDVIYPANATPIDNELRQVLTSCGAAFVCGQPMSIEPLNPEKYGLYLPVTQLFDDSDFAGMIACRLWNIKSLGVAF